jgi:predicted PurR-regulated permease PerM
MKIGSYETSNTTVMLVAILVGVLIIFAVMSIPKKPVVTTIPAINAAQTAMENQFKAQIADRDNQIKDAKARLIVSEGRYSALVIKYIDLQKEKDNVKPPVTNAETRDRFTALGYPPLPVK